MSLKPWEQLRGTCSSVPVEFLNRERDRKGSSRLPLTEAFVYISPKMTCPELQAAQNTSKRNIERTLVFNTRKNTQKASKSSPLKSKAVLYPFLF